MRHRIKLLSALLLALFVPAVSAEECGNCFGAGEPGQCCNTCDEVIAAYKKKNWGFKKSDFGQCRDEAEENDAQDSKKIEEKLKAQAKAAEEKRKANEAKKAEEEANQQAISDAKRQAASEQAKKHAEEIRKQQEETKRKQAEEAAKKQDEETMRRQAEEDEKETKRKQAEEAAKKQDEEARRRQAEEDEREWKAEEARRQAEQAKKAEENRKAEEAKQLEEERKAEEMRKVEEENSGEESQQSEQGKAAEKKSASGNGNNAKQEAADGDANDVMSRVTDKLHELRDSSAPIIDKAESALHMLQEGARTVANSRAGQAAGDAAHKVYDEVTARAGVTAQRVMDKVSEEAAEVLSGISTDRSWLFLFLSAVGILITTMFTVTLCTCLVRRRRRRLAPKEKADLDYTFTPGSVEEGACFKEDCKDQPFQLYHEFEYTMRRRNNKSSYSPDSDEDKYNKPTPPRSFTYRQSIHSNDGQPLLVAEPVRYKMDDERKILSGVFMRLAMGAVGFSAIALLGGRYLMPADMTYGELWLATAEFVDQHVLGHHGLVL